MGNIFPSFRVSRTGPSVMAEPSCRRDGAPSLVVLIPPSHRLVTLAVRSFDRCMAPQSRLLRFPEIWWRGCFYHSGSPLNGRSSLIPRISYFFTAYVLFLREPGANSYMPQSGNKQRVSFELSTSTIIKGAAFPFWFQVSRSVSREKAVVRTADVGSETFFPFRKGNYAPFHLT